MFAAGTKYLEAAVRCHVRFRPTLSRFPPRGRWGKQPRGTLLLLLSARSARARLCQRFEITLNLPEMTESCSWTCVLLLLAVYLKVSLFPPLSLYPSFSEQIEEPPVVSPTFPRDKTAECCVLLVRLVILRDAEVKVHVC